MYFCSVIRKHTFSNRDQEILYTYFYLNANTQSSFFSFLIISQEQQQQQSLIIILRIHSILFYIVEDLKFIIIQMTRLLNHRTFHTTRVI